MELRTVVNPVLSQNKIDHHTPVLFVGSCFASEIGSKAEAGKIPVLINPHGTLFNPLSVSDALLRFAEGYTYSTDDLFKFKERFYSLNHYTAFSSEDPAELVERLNVTGYNAIQFLRKASFLFVTFGTAWLFDLRETGRCVANCHKLPSEIFTRRQAETEEIVNTWLNTLDVIHKANPSIKIWLTVSPVRHMSDGLQANQLSKARLLLACEKLISHPAVAGYFPSYEMFMDDLRDYRFYAQDMVHPSETAIQYVWEKFAASFFSESTFRLWSEGEKITRARQHIITGGRREAMLFADTMLKKIAAFKKTAPLVDLNADIEYFNSIRE